MADYTVQIIVKEKDKPDWLAACDKYNNQHVYIDASNGNISFRYDCTGMTPADKGKHVMVQLLKAFLEMYRTEQDKDLRYVPAIQAVPPPTGAVAVDAIT